MGENYSTINWIRTYAFHRVSLRYGEGKKYELVGDGVSQARYDKTEYNHLAVIMYMCIYVRE